MLPSPVLIFGQQPPATAQENSSHHLVAIDLEADVTEGIGEVLKGIKQTHKTDEPEPVILSAAHETT